MTNPASCHENPCLAVLGEKERPRKNFRPAWQAALQLVSPLLLFGLFVLAGAGGTRTAAAQSPAAASRNYTGFDRNGYPGDDRLAALHRSFAFAGYWLNAPPGAQENSWTGKRALLRAQGFGFLILLNGRLDAMLLDAARRGKDAATLGRADAQAAATAAAREGFPAGAIVFLDQEEGGRLLPEQATYLFAWVEQMRKSRYRPGVYCSGIEVGDGASRISTAEDILNRESKEREQRPTASPLALWIANDQCPPSPGCSVEAHPAAAASARGVPSALIWQYAQSPRRPQFTRQCATTYAPDGNCYAPGVAHDARSFIDLDVASSDDPSHGR
jgi:hypothetical protein